MKNGEHTEQQQANAKPDALGAKPRGGRGVVAHCAIGVSERTAPYFIHGVRRPELSSTACKSCSMR